MLSVFLLHLIFGILGGILGATITNLVYKHIYVAGLIEVDDRSNLCKVHVTSTELANKKTKKVLFNVVHNVDLSREEQIL